MKVKVVGATTEEAKKEATKYFKGGRRRIHLCYKIEGGCPEGDQDAFHINQFTWYPPGDFPADYRSSRAKKEVAKGKEMEHAEKKCLEP